MRVTDLFQQLFGDSYVAGDGPSLTGRVGAMGLLYRSSQAPLREALTWQGGFFVPEAAVQQCRREGLGALLVLYEFADGARRQIILETGRAPAAQYRGMRSAGGSEMGYFVAAPQWGTL